MTWGRPELILLVPLATAAIVGVDAVRAGRVRRLWLALRAMPAGSRRRRPWPTTFACAGASAAILALAQPGGAPAGARAPTRSTVLLAVDVSRSMSVTDVAPNRATVARLAALGIATSVRSTSVGVMAFTQEAHVLLPPSSDVGLVARYLEALDDGVLSSEGSDLARTLDEGTAASAPEGSRGSGVVVLISDGEGFQDEDSLRASIERAKRAGVVVHTLVVGTPRGGEVRGAVRNGWSSARPDVMARIAAETGGIAADARSGEDVRRIVAASAPERTEPLRPVPGQTEQPGGFVAWLTGLALLALLGDWGLDVRAGRVAP